MKTQVNYSKLATAISVCSGLVFGPAIYSVCFYQFRSFALLLLVVALSGVMGPALMLFSARIISRLTGVESRRLEIPSSLSVASLLVIYLGFPLSFMEISFHEGKEILIAFAVFFFINLFICLAASRRWVILAVLAVVISAGLVTGAALPHGLVRVHLEEAGRAYLFPDRITFAPLEDTSPEGKPGVTGGPPLFRVLHAGHTRTGFYLYMNQSIESAVNIPEEGRLRFDVGVAHPGGNLAPARLLVMVKDIEGNVSKVYETFIKRREVSWEAHEVDLSGLAPGGEVIQLQLYSTDEGMENFEPLVISNMSLFSAQERPRETRGGVILVVLDALRADALGCYGSKAARTPVIDRLAAQGVIFDKAVSPSSWTLPAVAGILTSRMPSQHGALSYLRVVQDRELTTLPEVLAGRGVETKASISNWLIHSNLNFDKGFNDFYLEPLSRVSSRSTEALMKEAAGWLRNSSGGPFFLYLHNMDPHHPYLAPEPYSFSSRVMDGFEGLRAWFEFGMSIPYIYGIDLDAHGRLTEREAEELRLRYLGEVEYVDDRLAELERTLRETGLWDDTLLIITSDHGEEFQEHGTLRHGNNLHSELIRVPLIFSGGAVSGRSRRIDSPVSLLDLYPTILEFFGAPLPPEILGRSLMPLIEGGEDDGRMVFSELVEAFNHEYLLMSAVKGNYHFIRKAPLEKMVPVERKLYNWESDPGEMNDLSSSEPDRVREMEAAMDEFFDSLPGKKSLDTAGGEGIGEAEARLRALGYLK